ncbi:MAG: glutathione S-transferase family protein [Pseudomonadota bacterium]
MAEITLYGYATSPFVRKVGCFLHYKDLPFTFTPVNPVNPDAIAFTKGRQVPVLKIGDEWRRESSELGSWLDELYPEKPLLPKDPADREAALTVDSWISDSFLPSFFRAAIDAPDDLRHRQRAWRLAALVSAHTPLPEEVRNGWPDLLRVAPFIQAMIKPLDRDEPLDAMQMRLGAEMLAHLGDGPFLGGLSEPSIADFSLFPQLTFGVVAGLEHELSAGRVPAVKTWLQRVAKHLPEQPLLIQDFMVVTPLKEALA